MSFKNVLNKTPLQLSGAVMGVVNFLIINDTIHMKVAAVSGLNLAMIGVFGLFVATKTANKAVLNELAGGES